MDSSIRLLDCVGFPSFGGSVALLCEWRITASLAQQAEDAPIALATHVRDAAGRLLLADGPRSHAVKPSERAHAVAVPLMIPNMSGVYHVEVDAVVEQKFWASWLGMAPLRLRIERRSDGSLCGETAPGETRFTLGAHRVFRITTPYYGMGDTERSVEIPWVLSRYRGEARVLDVGYAFAEPRYIDALTALRIPTVVGVDLAVGSPPALRVVADVRHAPFRPGCMEFILAVSVIEHIGRDNRSYLGGRSDPQEAHGDLAAIRALATLLAPTGRLLLTVPFGVAEDHGWFRQYDSAGLHALIRASGLIMTEVEYFQYRGAWEGPVSPSLLANRHYGQDAIAASGIACLTLTNCRPHVIAHLATGPR